MEDNDLANGGERMTADAGNWSYYAHLSIYRFALPYTTGKRVLDAGCGTGYGSAYLARHGTVSLIACDAAPYAITYCKRRFADDRVTFETVDLCKPLPYPDRAFDTIFSSNVMEHLAEIDQLLGECSRMLVDDGIMIAAVPPNRSPEALKENIKNVFHAMNLTPKGWYHKLARYFEHVECHLHQHNAEWVDPQKHMKEFGRPANEVTIREIDFIFPKASLAILNQERSNITAAFVARTPRREILASSPEEHIIPYQWHYGSIIAEVIKEERAKGSPDTHTEIPPPTEPP